MKFSVWPDPSRPPGEILDLARVVDDGDWFGFWYADHYMPNTGDESFVRGDLYECWSILSAVAAVTSNVRLGPLVAPTSVHHPALLANRASTIDHLSGGRFVLGMGAGWQINEHRAYGIELEPAGRRVDRFEESIQVVRSLLDDDRTDFAGDVYEFRDAPCDPKPVQAQLPIVVGTGSPRMLRITCTHAQEWNTWGGLDLAAERRAIFVDACESVGTDPASMHTSVQAIVVITNDSESAERALGGPMGDRTIAGPVDKIVDDLGRYAEMGFDEFIVLDRTFGATTAERLDGAPQFVAEIASQVADT